MDFKLEISLKKDLRMIALRIVLGCALITSAFVVPTLAETWRSIVPLSSNRSDVERLLGSPVPGQSNLYTTSSEQIRVTYAEAHCAYGWQVPLQTVISVMVYPKTSPKFADLRLDESRFEKRRDVDNEARFYYVDQVRGINYTVDAGFVTTIEYFPSAGDSYRKCVLSTTSSGSDGALTNPIKSEAARPVQDQKAYACPVHPDITSAERGFCHRCGRRLRLPRIRPTKKGTRARTLPSAFSANTSHSATTARAESGPRPWANLSPAERLAETEKLAGISEYTCVMHRDVHVAQEGPCPKCGMQLIPVNPSVREEYKLSLATQPLKPRPGDNLQLRLSIKHPHTKALVKKYVLNHEKLFHLFIVSQDLEEYQHIHPQIAANGTFSISTVLPRAGLYKLHADFFPVGGLPQVIHRDLRVPGHHQSNAAVPVLTPDTSLVKTLDGMRIILDVGSDPLTAGQLVSLKYRLVEAQSGEPIRDLEPYLGAWGHTLILNPDQSEYLHSHPTEMLANNVDGARLRSGPEVNFKTIFPSSGPYRIWTQFQRAGKVTTVSYTVNVK